MDIISINNCRLITGAIFIFSLLFASSCAQNQEYIKYTNDQLGALKKRTEELEKNAGGKIDNMVSSQASIMAEIETLRSEIRELTGRIEDTEHLVKRNLEMELGDQNGGGSISERLIRLEKTVKDLQKYLNLEPFVLVPAKNDNESNTGVPIGELSDLDSISMEGKSKDEALYETSLLLFKNGQYEQAISGFKSFLQQYPKSDLADNSQYWIGECFMNMKQYEQAILAFQDVIKNYPNENKVPNAMLRQAIAMQEIGDITSTKLILKKLIKTYPKSPEANIAESKLTAIN